MAYIHEGSREWAKSEFCFVLCASTHTSIESGLFVHYGSMSSIYVGAPIPNEFEIVSSGDDYIDFTNLPSC